MFKDFGNTQNPTHLSYTEYSNRELLGTMFYKWFAGIESMQSMTYDFNKETTAKNLSRFMEGKEKEYLPHAVTYAYDQLLFQHDFRFQHVAVVIYALLFCPFIVSMLPAFLNKFVCHPL